LAKLPVIAAYAHKKSVGQAFLYPDNSLGFVENFLKLNFGVNSEPYEINPTMVEGPRTACSSCTRTTSQNASTSTVRLAKLPVIAAYAHKKSVGQAFLYPDNSLGFVENF
ncbi:hypothetical protein CTI14_56835, partial [Methylobacterium radiotolerans]